MIEKKCLNCGKKYFVKKYREKTSKFCGKSCSSKYNYEEKLGNVDQSYKYGNKFREGKKPINAFKKGHNPWNKGTKGVVKANKTSFKKGYESKNKLPLLTIKKRKENDKYRNFIKIAEPNVWVYYSKYLWEKENKIKVPKGYVVHHKNFNRLDDRIENLILVSRAEHLSIHNKNKKQEEDILVWK